MTTAAHEAHDAPPPHGHEHPKFLAHHFDTPQQQFDSGKLGVWLFLTTEILLFSGLFCAYSVYRANHPEIFAYAHLYLDKFYGALNTIVLIFSSFTMAWAVRASQLGTKPFFIPIPVGGGRYKEACRMSHRTLCLILLATTIVCGGIFMCVKYVEYSAKFKHFLLPGPHYMPSLTPEQAEGHAKVKASASETKPPTSAPAIPYSGPTTAQSPAGFTFEQSQIPRAAIGPTGVNEEWSQSQVSRFSEKTPEAAGEKSGPEPYNTQIFFSIYFLMTGLHGLHVLAGMALIFWVFLRTRRGDFGPEYFSPVDFVGLYWHIVDLIWIFLFPLLYLIGNTP